MHCPYSGDQKCLYLIAHQPPCQQKEQNDIAHMQCEVDEVISGWLVAVLQDCVIQEIRKGGNGPVETRGNTCPPITMNQYLLQVLWGRLLDAGILPNQVLVIENEAALKRIGPGKQDDQT